MEMNFKTLLKGLKPENIIDNYPDAIIVINYQKNIVFWNNRAEQIFGYSRREIINKNINVVFEEDIEKIYQNLGGDKSLVIKTSKNNGEEIYVEITCMDSPSLEEVVIAARNVTQTQKMLADVASEYDKIKEINRNKSLLLTNLSHEIKTPMHSIIGFSQALLDKLGGELSEKQEKYISIISRNANSLLELLNTIIDIAKIESDKMEFEHKTFDVAQSINLVADTLRLTAEDKKLQFSVDLTDLIKRSCYSDENMLRQVLLAVMKNAVKFTDVGSVMLKVSHPDLDFVRLQGMSIPEGFTDKSYLMFSVIDTGIGVAENELDNIFNEFREIDRTILKRYGGSGLSLALIKKILFELGGIIWVESEVGQGSTFSFIIPVEKVDRQEKQLEIEDN